MTDFEIERRELLRATGVGALGSTMTAIAAADGELNVDIRQVNRPEFPGITLFASVRDSNGNSLTDLSKSDFTLNETRFGTNITSSQQAIDSLSPPETDEAENISTSVVIDKSGSMGTGTRMEDAIEGGKQFVQQFGSNDEGLVVAFNETVDIRQRWTTDTSSLVDTIDNIGAGGNTALFDAVVEGINESSPRTDQERIGRSAVVVLADGQDNSSSVSLSDAINTAQQQSVPIYTIGLGNTINPGNLEQLADETGGEYYQSADGSDLNEIYNSIAESIANEYRITYVTNDDRTDGKEREIQLDAAYNGKTGSDVATYEEPCAPLPTASFNFSPEAVVEGQEVSFDGTTSQPNGGQLVSYEWDFNNDGAVDSTGETTTHTYSQPGSYNIGLTVEKTCGATDVEVQSIVVANEPVSIVDIKTNDPITEGETLEVEIELKNTQFDKENRSVVLQDFEGSIADAEPVQVGRGESLTITLEWDTERGDAGTDNVTIRLSDITVDEEVEIQEASIGGEFDSLAEDKLGSDGIAEQIDTTSVIASVSDDLGADIGDKPMAESTIKELRDAVVAGEVSQETAEEAVRRMIHGEQAVLDALEFIGSDTAGFDDDDDEGDDDILSGPINYSKRVAKYLVETLLGLLTQIDGILNVVFRRIPDWAQEIINLGGNNILQSLRDEVITTFIANTISVGDARERTKQEIQGLPQGIVDDIVNGVYTTGQEVANAISDAFEVVGDVISGFVQAGIETGAIQVVTSPTGISTVGALATGSSTVWGAASRINNQHKPANLPNSGPPGTTQAAISAKKDGIDYMRTLMDNSREWLKWIKSKILDFSILGNLVELIQDIVDITNGIQNWNFIQIISNYASYIINAVQLTIGIVKGVVGLFVSAGAAASAIQVTSAAGTLLGQIISDVIAGEQTPVNNFPNLPDPNDVFEAGGESVPPWAEEFASEVNSGI